MMFFGCLPCCGGSGGCESTACWKDCNDWESHASDFTSDLDDVRATLIARSDSNAVDTSRDAPTFRPDDGLLSWFKDGRIIQVQPVASAFLGQTVLIRHLLYVTFDVQIRCNAGNYVVAMLAGYKLSPFTLMDYLAFTACDGTREVWENTGRKQSFGVQFEIPATAGFNQKMIGRFECGAAGLGIAVIDLLDTNQLMRQFDPSCTNGQINPLP